jgi:hypothetical protein
MSDFTLNSYFEKLNIIKKDLNGMYDKIKDINLENITEDSVLQFNGTNWEPLDISGLDVEPSENFAVFAKVVTDNTFYNPDTLYTISNWSSDASQNVNVNLSGFYTFQIIHSGVYKIETNLNFVFAITDPELRITDSTIIKIEDTLTPVNNIYKMNLLTLNSPDANLNLFSCDFRQVNNSSHSYDSNTGIATYTLDFNSPGGDATNSNTAVMFQDTQGGTIPIGHGGFDADGAPSGPDFWITFPNNNFSFLDNLTGPTVTPDENVGFTLEICFKLGLFSDYPNSTDANVFSLVTNHITGEGLNIRRKGSTDELEYRYVDNFGNAYSSSFTSSQFSANYFEHVIITYSLSKFTIYLNGTAHIRTSPNGTFPIDSAFKYLSLGRNLDIDPVTNPSQFDSGNERVRFLRIYGKIMSRDEVDSTFRCHTHAFNDPRFADISSRPSIPLRKRGLREIGGLHRNFSSAVTLSLNENQKIALNVKSEIQSPYVLESSSFIITKID